MFPHEDSLIPIFMWRSDESHPEQIGTGIYLRMLDRAYLLTAGHVADLRSEGALCIPTKDGISSLQGGIGGNILVGGQDRKDDKFDIAYIRLAELYDQLAHPTFVPLPRANMDLDGNVLPGDFCSIGGYPITQATRSDEAYASAAYSYVGIAAEHSEYARLGYDPAIHVIVRYHIKKGIFPEGERTNPPHPRGLSGGGIFRLRPGFLYDRENAPRLLVGAMHTFLRRENCFIGTRLPGYLLTIKQRFPNEVLALMEP